jgi:predicted Zn finger-like uncharacterized protein
MPIRIPCPHCQKEYILPDDKQGKTVRCKQCQQSFIVALGDEATPAPSSEPTATKPAEEGFVRSQSLKKILNQQTPQDRLNEAPPNQIRTTQSEGGQPPNHGRMISAVVAVVGILLTVSGAGWAIFKIVAKPFDSDGQVGQLIDQAQKPLQPGPGPGPAPKAAPKAPLDEALESLRGGNGHDRTAKAEWLAKQRPVEAKRPEVARELERLTKEGGVPWEVMACARALEVWGTRESSDALLALLDHENRQVRTVAMETLGNLKEDRAAEPIGKLLGSGFEKGKAMKALASIGPGAEKELVKHFDHPDGGIQGDVRKLLKEYGTKDSVILPQAVSDLRSENRAVKKSAASWLAQTTADEKYRAEVAPLLEPLLAEKDNPTREAGAKALAVWATRDNIPRMIQGLSDRHEPCRSALIDALGRLKDERGLEAIAGRLQWDRAKVSANLVAAGPIAEKAVWPALASKDAGVRLEACKILKAIGGKDSIEPLKKALADRDAGVKAAADDAMKAVSERK